MAFPCSSPQHTPPLPSLPSLPQNDHHVLSSPNAIAYTLRHGIMVVRAATKVASGAELCLNYLGRGALRPLSQRQIELQASYGFTCACQRCVVALRILLWSELASRSGSAIFSFLLLSVL
jgi:hypothetical protein